MRNHVNALQYAIDTPLGRGIGVALAFFLAAEVGHFLSFRDSHFASFWPCNGIALAALLTSSRKHWGVLLVGAALANACSNQWHGQPLAQSALFCIVNVLEIAGIACIMSWLSRGRTRAGGLRGIAILLIASIICVELAATIASAGLCLLNPDASYFHVWRSWWSGDMLGILIATPFVLVWWQRLHEHPRRWSTIVEAVLAGTVTLWLAGAIFSGTMPLTNLPFGPRFPIFLLPAIMWCALRFKLRGAVLANVAIALIAAYYTSRGQGPASLITSSTAAQALMLQVFLGITSMVALLLGATASERVRSIHVLRRLAVRLSQQQRALAQRTHELQHALGEIKTLRGLIPMCASCKSIRDDHGDWTRLEAYLMQHTEAEFSHGICNDCGLNLYGDLWKQAMQDAARVEAAAALLKANTLAASSQGARVIPFVAAKTTRPPAGPAIPPASSSAR